MLLRADSILAPIPESTPVFLSGVALVTVDTAVDVVSGTTNSGSIIS
jgi:hypothetical protein